MQNQKAGTNPRNPGGKFNFTEAAIAALPIPQPGTRAVYRDTQAPGLQLRVTSSGVKTFSIFRRVKGGRPERLTLDRTPPMTVKQARIEAAKANASIASGENPAEVRRAVKGELTFGQLFDDYLKLYAKVNKRTWREDESIYRRLLEKPLGNRRLSEITGSHIAAIGDSITRKGAPIMANRTLATISLVFGWGIKKRRCTENPAAGLHRNKENHRARFLSREELPRFFQSLRAEPHTTLRDYFLVSLLTGARRSNVLAMRWQDVDLETGQWRIERTKNDEPALLVLSPEAVAVLRKRKPKGDEAIWVFPGPGATGHLQEPRKAWARIFDRDELVQLKSLLAGAGIPFKEAAGENLPTTLRRARAAAGKAKFNTTGTRIHDLRIHDLRRTFGSWQAIAGASLPIIGKSLNHKTPQATAIYARLDLDPVRASVEKATSAMLAAAGRKTLALPGPLRSRERR